MTAGAFAADLDWLDQFCNQLNSSTCSLQAALGALKETGPIRTGHDELDDACGKFHDRWDDGLDIMNKAISTMSEKVTICVQAYRANEAAVTNAYNGAVPAMPGVTQAGTPADSHITSVLG